MRNKKITLSDGSWYPSIPDICHCKKHCNEIVYDGHEYISGHQNIGRPSKNHTDFSGERNPFKNHHHKQEIKDKISLSNTKTFLLKPDGTKEIYPKIPVICGCPDQNCHEICWNGSEFKPGHHTKTKDFRIIQSRRNKGKCTWNKGLKDYFGFLGLKHPLLGTHCSEERKEKISKGNIGKTVSEEQKQKSTERMKVNNPMFRPEVRAKVSGENNSQYIDGHSHDPYCEKFNNSLRQEVRKRDYHICQFPRCLCTQLESLIVYGKSLHVHHIYYLKSDCYPDLITLCIKHNIKVNTNRDYWESFFMNKLNERSLLFWTRRYIK